MKRYLVILLLLLISCKLGWSFDFVLPKDSAYFISNNINFEWDEDPNAENYELTLTDAFNNVSTFTVYSTDTSIILSGNEYTGTITPMYQSGQGQSSQEIIFYIVDLNAIGPTTWFNSDSSVVYDGSNLVEQWTDISGNNLHLLQSNTSSKPTFSNSIPELNQHPALTFDGGDLLNSPNLNLTDVDLFVVLKGNNTNNEIFGFGNGYHFNFVGIRPILYLQGSNYRYFQGLQETGIYQLHNVSWTNGSASGLSTFLKLNTNDLQYASAVSGSGFVLNNLEVGANSLNGDISEIIVFDRQLSTTERKSIEGYLKSKYAPPVNLGPNISMYGFCDTTLYINKHFESYLWSDGSTADSLIVSEPGTYWVETTDIFGFTSRDTVEVSYQTFNYPSIQTYCPSDSITWYTNLGPDYNYLWSDGSTADSLSIDSPGDYHVEITDTNGCVFQSDTLTFGPDPFESIVTLGPDLNLCSGNTMTLQDGDSLAVDYLWNTSSTDSAIVLNNSGTYYVDVINENGCEASDTIDITIIGDAPNVTIGAPATVCEGELFTFEDFSNTTDGSTINAWNWDLGDGTVINVDDSSHVYSSDGSFDITLTISTSAGCSNTETQQIDVIQKPEMTFVSANQCQDQLISFNGGQLSAATITSWEWNFDDPSSGNLNTATGQNTSHSFGATGDYDVMLVGTDINGCQDTVVQSKTIIPSPQVDFDFDEVCEGEVVSFVNETTVQSPVVVSSYMWSFGDGTNSGQTEPERPYTSSGNYTVNLVATGNNGCSDQLSQNLKVHALPMIDRAIESSCAGLNTTLSDNSFVPNGSVAQVFWSIENGSPLSGFTVNSIFEESGVVEVEQTVNSAFGCTNSETFNLSIDDYLEADFDYFPNALIAGAPTEFTSNSVGADTYEWTFDNFGVSYQQDTSIIFPSNLIGDTMMIQLAVENSFGCRDSMFVELPVYERKTDLLVDELFLQENNDFYTTGVRLTNLGTTPINEVDLFLQTPGTPVIKETWDGLLLAGETTIHIFNSEISSIPPLEDTTKNYVCTRGIIVEPSLFEETDLSNNEVCNIIEPSQTIILAPQPNPVNDQYEIKVILSEAERGTLKVYDNQGRVVDVIFENILLENGLNTFKVDASHYANGGYTLRYVGEELTQNVKIIKQ